MNYIKIDTEDLCNGDGLRVVLWLSGCSHHCYNCQNPQTWNPDSGILFDKSAEEELFSELSKDYISGLTLTGGDPLNENNLDGVLNLVNKIRLSFGDSKTIWLYTGNTLYFDKNKNLSVMKYIKENEKVIYPAIQSILMQDILKNVDVVVDGRYIDSKRDITLQWRGSSNQRIINIQKSLQEGEIVLWET